MNCDGGEVALPQKLVKLGGAQGRLDKDDDLVELQFVKKLVELPVLLALLHLGVVLLETMKSELRILIDIVLRGVLHELLADGLDFIGERSAEHHDLFLLGRGTEDFLHVAAHICIAREGQG